MYASGGSKLAQQSTHPMPGKVAGIRGTVADLDRQSAIIVLDSSGYRRQTARMHIAVIKRGMHCGIDDLTLFMKRGDKVIAVIEKMSDVPLKLRRGSCPWNVFDVYRDVQTSPRPAAFTSLTSYMKMQPDQIPLLDGRSRAQTAELCVSIRQILSIWNVIDLDTFLQLWQFKSTNTYPDANSLRRFVNDCLKGVYCEISGGQMKLYQGFDEEEIHHEMKQRFAVNKRVYPRTQTLSSIVAQAILVETTSLMAAILNPLLQKATMGEKVVVGVDCEGVNLGRSGSLTLLQIATTDNQVYLFDVLKNRALLMSEQLKQLLEDQRIVKVMHDCRGDSSALRYLFNIKLAGVFDTSVAYSTIMEQCNKLGKPYRISYKALCEALGEDSSFKDDATRKRMLDNREFWKQRPLTDDMKNYAAADSVMLVPHVYKALDGMISPFWRDYFDVKCKEALTEL